VAGVITELLLVPGAGNELSVEVALA